MIRVLSQYGRAGTTFALTSTNTATAFTSAVLEDGGRQLCAIILQVITNNVKLAFGTSPIQGAGNLGHLIPKDQLPIYFIGETLLENLKYISAESGAHGVMMITPFYQG
jgi:hypothetical protein